MELRAKQIREMQKTEIEERLKSFEESLLKERASVAMGGAPRNPGKIRSLRRQIARINTVLSGGPKE
ncbi:MAG: 50S ribosomal protein L29 [Thermoplasmatales archaeon B_DKE]|nr:MAG: 50S ribosomal protein L29 [Thermoplasmatales archaeon B_DKE]QRF75987.1 Hmal29 [Thermoplasmatales archaeon]